MHSDEVKGKLTFHFAMKCLATLAFGSPNQDFNDILYEKAKHTKSCSSFPRYHDTFCRGALLGIRPVQNNHTTR